MKKVAILIASCDRYNDVWNPFFTLFHKYWPDCPYEVYLGTNYLDFKSEGVNVVKIGADKAWADNITKMLDAIDADYVLFALDDFLLCSKVDTPRVCSLIDFAIKEGVGCLRMNPFPMPSKKYKKNNQLGIIKDTDAYNVSTQVALWSVDVLRKLLVPGYSAWDFELKGTESRYKINTLFLGTYEELFMIYNGIIRGKWVSSSLEKLKEEGIEVDLNKRDILINSTRNTPGYHDPLYNRIRTFLFLHIKAKYRIYRYRLKKGN